MTSSWLAAIGIGVILSFIWPPIGAVIDEFSEWATAGRPAIAVFICGLVERLLLPFGLHHMSQVSNAGPTAAPTTRDAHSQSQQECRGFRR